LYISDYTAQVLINSSEIPDWTAFNVSMRIGRAEVEGRVDLQRPITISNGSTLTIKEGFSGTLTTLLSNKEIENAGGNLTHCTLRCLGSKISRKAPLKTVYYINETWLKLVLSYYYLQDGIIYAMQPYNDTKINGVSPFRVLFIPELPGHNLKDHEFECRIKPGITHHQIIGELATLCGLSLNITTPDLPVQKSLVVSSHSPYWSTIAALVAKWNPLIYINGTTLNIIDAGGSKQSKPGIGSLVLTEDSFKVYDWNVTLSQDIIDHVVIRGPSINYTYIAPNSLVGKRSVSKTELPGTEITLQTERNIEDGQTEALEYLKRYNANQRKPYRTVSTVKKKVDPMNPSNMVTTWEQEIVYNQQGNEISKRESEYYYADFHTPVGQTSDRWALAVDAGGGYIESVASGYYQALPSTSLVKVETVTVEFLDYITPIGASEVDITVTGLCVVYASKVKVNGEEYISYEGLRPITDAMLIGEEIEELSSEAGIGYQTVWMTIRKTIIRYDQSSPSLLRKRRTDIYYVPYPTSESRDEDIPLPNRRESGVMDRVWEYFAQSGDPVLYTGGSLPTGDFHPKIELYDPDIVDEPNAYKIAQRLMHKRPEYRTTGEISLTLPMPGLRLGSQVSLPACSKTYFDWTTNVWTTVQIPAKTFWIIEHSKNSQHLGDPEASQRQLDIEDRFVIADSY
jgi:hypothetical protein